jgi:hypothetical protein
LRKFRFVVGVGDVGGGVGVDGGDVGDGVGFDAFIC